MDISRWRAFHINFITKSILILWSLFQPGGPWITLVSNGLPLPFLAFLGFVEALVLMFFLVWWANKYYKKHYDMQLVKAIDSSHI